MHISNTSEKVVRKLELRLEKTTVFYKYAAASTEAGLANHLRLPDRTEKEIVDRWVMKKARKGWQGVPPHSQDTRTCGIQVPLDLVTITIGA